MTVFRPAETETEGQVIVNCSRDIGFTMDLVVKDLGPYLATAGCWRARYWTSRPGCWASSSAPGPATAPGVVLNEFRWRLEVAAGLDVLSAAFP